MLTNRPPGATSFETESQYTILKTQRFHVRKDISRGASQREREREGGQLN